MEDAEVVLRRAPLFEGLDEESARALRRQMPDVKLSRGEHLFMEGQEGDRLYIVLDGKLTLAETPGGGCTFLLALPATPTTEAPARRAPEAAEAFPGVRALDVDLGVVRRTLEVNTFGALRLAHGLN